MAKPARGFTILQFKLSKEFKKQKQKLGKVFTSWGGHQGTVPVNRPVTQYNHKSESFVLSA
jgi:transposase